MKLRFATPDELWPAALDLSAPGVHAWHTPSGDFIAHGYQQDSTCWMHWPSVAAFRFGDGDPFITAFIEPGASHAIVEDVYRRGVLPMAIPALGREALHASGILAGSGVVAFAARSHTGKSTIAYGLSRRGFLQWADDGVAFSVEGGRVTTVLLPFHVRLRPESSRLFGFDDPVFRQFAPEVPVAGAAARPIPLAGICLLRRMDSAPAGGAAVIEPIAPSQAFATVLIHAHEFNPFDQDRRRRMLQAYLEVAATVPVYDVRFAPGREHFDAVLDAITGTLGLRPPRQAQESVA